jgi:hypothetical protein
MQDPLSIDSVYEFTRYSVFTAETSHEHWS